MLVLSVVDMFLAFLRAYYFSFSTFLDLVRELQEGQHILPNVGVAIIAFPIVRPPGLEVEENTRAKFDSWLQGTSKEVRAWYCVVLVQAFARARVGRRYHIFQFAKLI